ncbi:hypothetical protein [Nocardia sp. NPDC020380]|uniref:hypothetical protein n=1 Tax=Nocardia sp. NPDC020380 TaxID=3364309 RepID=UPI0037AB1C91
MDPVTIIATAVAVGAAAGLTDSAKQSVVDAYTGLKSLIARRYHDVDIKQVEGKPESLAKRESLAEDLADQGAGDDSELLEAAVEVIRVVRGATLGEAGVVGIDLESVEAAALRIKNVRSGGPGVKVKRSRFNGDIDIQHVDAGFGEPPNPL